MPQPRNLLLTRLALIEDLLRPLSSWNTLYIRSRNPVPDSGKVRPLSRLHHRYNFYFVTTGASGSFGFRTLKVIGATSLLGGNNNVNPVVTGSTTLPPTSVMG